MIAQPDNVQTLAGLPAPFDRPTMTVAAASRVLGLSTNATYRAIRRGEIPSLRLGRRIVVPSHRLRSLLYGPSIDDEGYGDQAIRPSDPK